MQKFRYYGIAREIIKPRRDEKCGVSAKGNSVLASSSTVESGKLRQEVNL